MLMLNPLFRLAKDENGAQVVEYALIIAVVSIALVIVLSNTTAGIGASFSTIVSRVTDCITGSGTCS